MDQPEPAYLDPQTSFLDVQLTDASAAGALVPEASLSSQEPPTQRLKASIRGSLKASTLDGVFAAIYVSVTSGVLLTNFLLELGANTTQIGLIASIPMVANLLQPIGAYFSEQVTSRHWYCFWIYTPARMLWVILAIGIGLLHWNLIDSSMLINWTLAIVTVSHVIGAFGSAAWLSWMAMLVPRRLRGRYFGLRNSAGNLTVLIAVPVAGAAVTFFPGGPVLGFGFMLVLAIVFGIVSLLFQNFMEDINPKLQQQIAPQAVEAVEENEETTAFASDSPPQSEKRNADFWIFLIYFSGWMFAFSLSAPFFNLFMLDNLSLSLSQVTIYNSLMAGANLAMLTIWGRLSDKIGNRPLLFGAGLVVALTPLLWLLVGRDSLSVWLWLPLLHLLMGGSASAIELCSNNLQIGVAPVRNQSTYFGWIAATAGVSGATGTTLGGFLAEHWQAGGLLGLFVVSSVCRVAALTPLFFVHEQRRMSLGQIVQLFSTSAKGDPEIVS